MGRTYNPITLGIKITDEIARELSRELKRKIIVVNRIDKKIRKGYEAIIYKFHIKQGFFSNKPFFDLWLNYTGDVLDMAESFTEVYYDTAVAEIYHPLLSRELLTKVFKNVMHKYKHFFADEFNDKISFRGFLIL